jgi:hypothetical protein
VNKAEKLDRLVGSVEELLAQLPESLGPSITALRDKVDDGIFDAWTTISRQRLEQRSSAHRAAPALAILLGAAFALAISARLLANRGTGPARQRIR